MIRLTPIYILLFLLSTPEASARVLRRSHKPPPDDEPIFNSLVIETQPETEVVESAIPPGFGFDDNSDQDDDPSSNADDEDQGIRNGNEIAPLHWYAVFQAGTLCGASLIHGDILLTAAHCVDDNGLPEQVRVGSNDYYSGGKVVNVIDGVLYPGWTWKKSSDPDLAILVLAEYLPNQVAQINSDPSIPESDQPSLFSMGFGLINDYSSSRALMGASIPYLDNCSRLSYSYDRTRHLCASSKDIATCGGDSGSPVTLSSSSNLQVGINSYSNGKCTSQTLDIYTRVSYFYDWIQQQICEKSKLPPKECMETEFPTLEPTETPTESPTETPTESPTETPTPSPTDSPTFVPTVAVTDSSTLSALAWTESPTLASAMEGTMIPSIESTVDEVDDATIQPEITGSPTTM
jgi:V8-like Glu-specific endopeptidase